MSTKHDDGGPAYPVVHFHKYEDGSSHEARWPGLSWLDLAAMHALVGMYIADELARRDVNPGGIRTTAREFAVSAYEQAAALLDEKRKRESPNDFN